MDALSRMFITRWALALCAWELVATALTDNADDFARMDPTSKELRMPPHLQYY
jgi:hypothetical protein